MIAIWRYVDNESCGSPNPKHVPTVIPKCTVKRKRSEIRTIYDSTNLQRSKNESTFYLRRCIICATDVIQQKNECHQIIYTHPQNNLDLAKILAVSRRDRTRSENNLDTSWNRQNPSCTILRDRIDEMPFMDTCFVVGEYRHVQEGATNPRGSNKLCT